MILHSMIDINNTIKVLKENGIYVSKQDIKNLSSYMTSHIKRLGEYIIDLESKPEKMSDFNLL